MALKEYFVSFPCFFNIVGPNPTENSFTFTLHSFATIKCPNSCIIIRNPNNIINLIADIINVIKITSYININNIYAKGAKNIKLSILSSIPP